MKASDGQPGLTDESLELPGDAGVPGCDLAEQAEIDALLRLQAGELRVPPGLAGRVRRVLWHRRLRVALELATAAAILIAFGVYVLSSPPPYKLDGRAEVTDDQGQASSLAPGAWIRTADAPATLKVSGHTRVEISPDARLQLAGPAETCHLKLDYGRIALTMDKRGGQVVIETAAGKVTASGDSSVLRVQIDRQGGTSDRQLTLTVVAGQATLAGPSGVVQLGPGDVRTSATPVRLNPKPPGPESPREVPPIPSVPVPPGGAGGQGAAAPGGRVPGGANTDGGR